ncbi:TetR/AcrR family transcriptional regulator [Jeotgalibacillus terrae]|uniref:TetR/AcrR family transcriptional regulator n=1 Tax=Jeotgalibacillus terrae TaxID=587735 RepID=A0ABW5ZLV3_9BACL|nr:TetR/AcrR family transcriptional regulator [Jeotgalibacillus terrae]MBM7578116.1 TetR/AcrR family transcriptional repressor of nem operon [Jeotgalibacillus terrae]
MARSKAFDEKEVLKKAMQLFWEQGYEKTSMQDLVDQMGIHRRSIYDTFGDKRSLFLSSLSYYEALITTEMTRIMDSNLPMKQAIREVFEYAIHADGYHPKGCLAVNTAVELSLLDEEIAKMSTDMFNRTEKVFSHLIKKGQKNGECSKNIDPDTISRFLHNSLLGIRVLIKTHYTKKELESIIDVTLSVLD